MGMRATFSDDMEVDRRSAIVTCLTSQRHINLSLTNQLWIALTRRFLLWVRVALHSIKGSMKALNSAMGEVSLARY